MPASAFVSDAGLILRTPSTLSARARAPLRRPRAAVQQATRRRASPSAVFLPPNGVPDVPGDDEEMDGDSDVTNAFDDEGSLSRSGHQLGSIERILEETRPDYETWKDRNESRSLSLVRGASEYMLGAEELNEMLKGDHLQRHREVLAPDEAFGAIFLWDVVISNARELRRKAWAMVAKEKGFIEPDWEDIVRAEEMAPEAAISRVFLWTREWAEIKRCLFMKHEREEMLHGGFEYCVGEGLVKWLNVLARYGVRCILCSERPRERVMEILKRVGLDGVFTSNDLVCAEDEFESMEQMLLVAALKCQRPPQKCVVFTDRVGGITSAHEVSAKVVALLGTRKAYEVKSADEIVADWDELVVYNLRRLFAEQGDTLPKPQTQVERLD